MKTILRCVALAIAMWAAANQGLAGNNDTKVVPKDTQEQFLERLLKNGCLESGNGAFTLFVQDVKKRILFQPLLVTYDAKGQMTQSMWPMEGEIQVDQARQRLHIRMQGANSVTPDGKNMAFFEERVVAFEYTTSGAAKGKDAVKGTRPPK